MQKFTWCLFVLYELTADFNVEIFTSSSPYNIKKHLNNDSRLKTVYVTYCTTIEIGELLTYLQYLSFIPKKRDRARSCQPIFH